MSTTNNEATNEPLATGTNYRLITLKCYICTNEFLSTGDELLSADEFFCSPECAEDYVEALNDPDDYGYEGLGTN